MSRIYLSDITSLLVSRRRRGDADGDVAGRKNGLHDERGECGDESAHHRPFGVFGLPALDLPSCRDNHRERAEVRDAGQNAHASPDGGIEAGCLGENVGAGEKGAASVKVSGPEKVRVHAHDCTTTRRKPGKGYVGTTLKILRRYVGTAIFRAEFRPQNEA